jgi:hypothetical protein
MSSALHMDESVPCFINEESLVPADIGMSDSETHRTGGTPLGKGLSHGANFYEEASHVEWTETALDAEAKLRLKDFASVHVLGARLCDLRPDFARGWLLQYLAMKHLEAPQETLIALLQEAVAACVGGRGMQDLLSALAQETGIQDVTSQSDLPVPIPEGVQIFVGEWDAEGVYVYQAFCEDIADWALAHQGFGGPSFSTSRMTWIKPSFGWVLYRAGYGYKPGQRRILKIKIPHDALGRILSQCQCVDTNKTTRCKHNLETGCGNGRVQWDPERDVMCADGREPRLMIRRRAIQIGLKGKVLEEYLRSLTSIQDVTELGHKVCAAHRSKKKDAMVELYPELPHERPYMPHCDDRCLVGLGMLAGETASAMARIGKGKAHR